MALPRESDPARDAFKQVMIEKLTELARGTNSASTALKLAEAYAWVVAPHQPHGGDVTVSK